MKTNLSASLEAILLAAFVAFQPCLTHAAPASPSELLEKGIYTEETKGDVEGAITIYQQLVAEAKAGQSLAAQAQFRLGQCFLKKNRAAEATAAFEKLIADFPNEKELVAKAREHLPAEIALGPVTWVDGERMQLTLELATGLVIGAMETRADLVDAGGKKIWRVGRRMSGGGEMLSAVEADAETFLPIASKWKHTLLGEVTAVFRPGEVEMQKTGGTDSTKLPLDKTVFDNEECFHLPRRLPLAVGYKTTINVITTLGGGAIIPLGVDVVKKETLEVPAGKFDCFKLVLSIGQTLWYSDDAHRYLVQFEGGGATGKLAAITQRKPGEAVAFRDDALGVSFTAPADWLIFRLQSRSGKREPIAVRDAAGDLEEGELALVRTDSLTDAEKQSSRAWAEARFKEGMAKELKDVKIRPESWKNVSLGGRPGVSFVADFVQGDKPRVAFVLHVLGPKSSEAFQMACAPEKFDALKAAFDGIIASYRMTK